VDLRLEVAPALGTRGPAAPAPVSEDVGDDVPEAAEVSAAKRARVKPAGAAEDAAARVERLALLGVGQDRVRLLDLLEALLGVLVPGVAVRVIFPGQLAVGLLYLLIGRALADAQRRVWILGRHD
jgi:hypothetical protein